MQAVEHLHEHEHEHHHEHEHNHLREVLQGLVKTLLLLGMGVYFIVNIASGNLTNYINERFSWLSYVAAGLFFLLGASSAYELLRNRGHNHEHHHDHDDDHTHAPLTWPILAVVAIPLLIGTLIPSRPLGSAAVDGNISLNAVSVTNATTFTSDPLKWNVLDWLRAFNNADDISSFNGKQADVVGFVYREIKLDKNQMMVARFTVSCCVADASAIGLPVVWDKAADFTQDTWVEVKGKFQVGQFRGDTVPILIAGTVMPIDQPEHPYLYP